MIGPGLRRHKLRWLLVCLSVTALVMGCGSEDNGGGGNGNGFLFGTRLGAAVYMQPGPPAYAFPAWSGIGSGVRIDTVTQYGSTVHPDGTDIYEGTTQVVFGQITGPKSGVQVYVYSYTTEYYVQPLAGTSIDINNNSAWIAPSHAGNVTALLVRAGYSPPDVTPTLPAVDGVNVLAISDVP